MDSLLSFAQCLSISNFQSHIPFPLSVGVAVSLTALVYSIILKFYQPICQQKSLKKIIIIEDFFFFFFYLFYAELSEFGSAVSNSAFWESCSFKKSEIGFFLKVEYLVKIVKKYFLKKLSVWLILIKMEVWIVNDQKWQYIYIYIYKRILCFNYFS